MILALVKLCVVLAIYLLIGRMISEWAYNNVEDLDVPVSFVTLLWPIPVLMAIWMILFGDE